MGARSRAGCVDDADGCCNCAAMYLRNVSGPLDAPSISPSLSRAHGAASTRHWIEANEPACRGPIGVACVSRSAEFPARRGRRGLHVSLIVVPRGLHAARAILPATRHRRRQDGPCTPARATARGRSSSPSPSRSGRGARLRLLNPWRRARPSSATGRRTGRPQRHPQRRLDDGRASMRDPATSARARRPRPMSTHPHPRYPPAALPPSHGRWRLVPRRHPPRIEGPRPRSVPHAADRPPPLPDHDVGGDDPHGRAGPQALPWIDVQRSRVPDAPDARQPVVCRDLEALAWFRAPFMRTSG